MAKMKVSLNAKGLGSSFQKHLQVMKRNPELLKEVGDYTVAQIKGRVRSMSDDYKMPDLKQNTKHIRRALSKNGKNETHKTFNKDRSNLTFSGELLDSLTHSANQATGNVTITVEGEHSRAQRKDGSYIGDAKSNKQIAKELAARGFRFLFLSEKVKDVLKYKVTANLRRQLSAYRKLKKLSRT